MTLKHAYLLGIYSGAFPLGSCSSVLLSLSYFPWGIYSGAFPLGSCSSVLLSPYFPLLSRYFPRVMFVCPTFPQGHVRLSYFPCPTFPVLLSLLSCPTFLSYFPRLGNYILDTQHGQESKMRPP
jgi:hypothetical protein